MVDFPMPVIASNVEGWGPPSSSLSDMDLGICDFAEHLDKFPGGKIGRVCDFSISGLKFQIERAAKGKGKGKFGKGGKAPVGNILATKDDEGFSLVDRPVVDKSKGKGRGGFGRGKGRGKNIAVNYQEGILGKRPPAMGKDNNQKGKSKGKGGQRGRGLPSFRDWSVQTQTDWELKQEIMLSSLSKLQLDAREVKVEDLKWCGKLHNYDRSFDRLSVKLEKPLRRFEDCQFFYISASDDPYLPDLLQEDSSVTVIATDQVLACLVAASRSVYSWDIIVTKLNGKLIFDKRDGSQIDAISVNETAQEPPNNDDKESINSPMKLAQEAGCINQNFSQMVLDLNAPAQDMECPNPFLDEDDEESEPASGAYRYRKFTIPGNNKAEDEFERQPMSMIVRTEVNCKMANARDNKGYVCVKAVNEYDPKTGQSWRQTLESHQGACLATELKNNAFKIGRWTAQAILAGCDTVKLGYASRKDHTDSQTHGVLGVQTHLTDAFADQIGLTRNNLFGILRTMVDLIMGWEDGKYLLLKDPTKSVIRIHALPWDTFENDGDEDDVGDDDDDDQELDEDGNVAPQQPEGLRIRRG